jgi:geranyl-CoA carboxylase alpha subunit
VGADDRSAGPPPARSAPSGGSEPHTVGSVGASFFMMEMNTRLQVEHTVTEMLTGLDLVEWQIRIARGEPLPLTQDGVRLDGHAIEVRLCAEDVNHRPHTGRVLHFAPPARTAGLRFDHALETGSTVTPHYDSMLGKLVAHAPSRAQAIERLAHALDQTQLLGLPTNRAFLAACLRHPVFGQGEALIPFLAEHGDALRMGLAVQTAPTGHAALVALLAVQHARALPAAALGLPFARPLRMVVDGGEPFAATLQELGAGAVRVHQGEASHTAHMVALPDGRLAITLDTQRWTVRAARVGDHRWHVQLQDAGGTGAPDLWLDDLSHQPLQRAGAGSAARELRAPFNG